MQMHFRKLSQIYTEIVPKCKLYIYPDPPVANYYEIIDIAYKQDFPGNYI